MIKEATENDHLAKTRNKTFELLFGDMNTSYNRWGKSVSEVTTNFKKDSNNLRSNTIGCKVDARLLTNIDELRSKSVEIINKEAAKSLSSKDKVIRDKSKLAIKSKCILDNLVLNSTEPTDHLYILNLQLCGTQAEVCKLRLLDSGLYVYDHAFDLSLPLSINKFSEIMIDWISNLLCFKKLCIFIVNSTKSIPNSSNTETFDNTFSRNDGSRSGDDNMNSCNHIWVRGTFFPPTDTYPTPVFPKNFLNSPQKRKASEYISSNKNKKMKEKQL